MKAYHMKKKISTILIIIISIICLYNYKIKLSKKYTIAVIQCASNKSLDTLSNNFIKKITQLLDENNLNIIYKNAEASLSHAHTIASQLQLNKNINLFFTIGSSVSQAVAILEKERPIIIAGVNDPHAYHLNQNNICGTIETIDEEFILKMIQNTNCKSNRIGILRSAGDIQEKEFSYFKLLCQQNNKQVIDCAVTSESEILSITEKLCHEIDVLLIPCDSLVVSVLPFIIKTTKKYNIPVFTCFIEGKSLGAFGSTGIDYEKNGKDAANIASEIILNQNNCQNIGFLKTKYEKIYY